MRARHESRMSPVRRQDGLSSFRKPMVLCRLSKPGDKNDDAVSVIIQHQHRFLSFGSDINVEWQAKVHCPNTACEIQKNLTPVDNVEKCPTCPCDADSALLVDDMYTNGPMFDEVKPICGAATQDHPVDILMVGLGGAALHRHVYERCPSGTRVRSIEYEPRTVELAKRYFGLKLIEGASEVHVGDALEIA